MEKKKGLFYGLCKIDARSINEAERSVDVSFSSETPAFPYYWSDMPQILVHGDQNVDLSYLQNLGSVLLNHQPNGPGQPVEVIGKPDNIRIENRIGRATIIFDDDDLSEKIFKKVVKKSIRGVSVGATIHQAIELKAGEDYEGFTGPATLAIRWTPKEISITPIAADDSVGIERSISDVAENYIKLTTEEKIMDEKDVLAIVNKAIAGLARSEDLPKAEDIARSVMSQIAEGNKPKMAITVETLQDLLSRAGAISIEMKAKVADMATDGKTEPEILRAMTDSFQKADGKDSGGLENGTGIPGNQQTVDRSTKITTFKDLDDKVFFNGLNEPGFSI